MNEEIAEYALHFLRELERLAPGSSTRHTISFTGRTVTG
jgi:hypothetical protein